MPWSVGCGRRGSGPKSGTSVPALLLERPAGERLPSPATRVVTTTHSSPSPAFVEAAIAPIPQEIQHDLDGATRGVVHRNSHAQVASDMLPLADRHLHLRQDVPIGFRFVHEILRG